MYFIGNRFKKNFCLFLNPIVQLLLFCSYMSVIPIKYVYTKYINKWTICDKVCQWLAAGLWISPGTLVSFTNKTDHHDITEILLKVALNTITLTPLLYKFSTIYTKGIWIYRSEMRIRLIIPSQTKHMWLILFNNT
jgi:hypothetical protein